MPLLPVAEECGRRAGFGFLGFAFAGMFDLQVKESAFGSWRTDIESRARPSGLGGDNGCRKTFHSDAHPD